MELFINQIICGDCVDNLKKIDDSSVDLVVTSPPYGKIRNYESGYSFDFTSLSKELFRVVKDGAVVAWIRNDTVENGSKTGETFKQTLGFMDVGFLLYDVMIWEKSGVSYPAKNRYTQIHEYIILLSKGKVTTLNFIEDVPKLWEGSWGKLRTRNQDGTLTDRNLENEGKAKSGRDDTGKYGYKKRTTIWKVNNGHGFNTKDKIARDHPAIFPESLCKDIIITWSDEGSLVLDPMCGSGTTCKMAKLLNRNYIGIDISDSYCEIAKQRIQIAENN